MPSEALDRTGIDIVANIDHLLTRSSAQQRAQVLRVILWARGGGVRRFGRREINFLIPASVTLEASEVWAVSQGEIIARAPFEVHSVAPAEECRYPH